jgi:hypothetical protein
MGQSILIGIGAGTASALLFASLASGSLLSLLLFYVAPLPVLIAALGWSHWAGLVAGLTASASVGLLLGINYFLLFLIGIALPAWWLGYLSMLARPVGSNGSLVLEWYPVGRLVVWAALIGAILATLAMPGLGDDKAQLRAALKEMFDRIQATQPNANISQAEIDGVIGLAIAIFLPAAATSFTLVNIANLWLAGRVVSLSGRLKRPWPDISALTLPPVALALLAIAVVGLAFPDPIGTVSAIALASLITAYTVLGFAILHAITSGHSYRPYLLFAAYSCATILAAPLLGLPILAVVLLGVADAAFNIRGRPVQKQGPPTPPV